VQEVSAGAVLSVDPRVDIDAPTPVEVRAIGHGRIDLDDPAVFLALLEQDAVVNVTSVFDSRSIARPRCVRVDFFCGCSDLPVWRGTGASAVRAAPFLERSDRWAPCFSDCGGLVPSGAGRLDPRAVRLSNAWTTAACSTRVWTTFNPA
jgi:hypothetical protein